MKSGNLNFLEPSGPLQACNGTALPLLLPYYLAYTTMLVCYNWSPDDGSSWPKTCRRTLWNCIITRVHFISFIRHNYIEMHGINNSQHYKVKQNFGIWLCCQFLNINLCKVTFHYETHGSNSAVKKLPSLNAGSLSLSLSIYIYIYIYIYIFFHSFSILSDDRSKASSKTIPPHSAI
jgi:hypothetical protein